MSRTILLTVFTLGLAATTIAPSAGAGQSSNIPREERGMIMGTMAHLKTVKLQDKVVISDAVVSNDDVRLADAETAKFIKELARSCIQTFWGE